jgi:hypothetical protein
MSSILIVDGVKYELWVPGGEEEFEEIIKEHSKEIFGAESLYIDVKKRIKSASGISSIPDGYLVDFSDNSLWIVEVELSEHSHKHMIIQLDAFLKGIKNPKTQREIIETLYSVIKGDVLLEAFMKKRVGSKDMHHFLSQLFLNDVGIIVVIEELNEKIEKAFENFKVQPYFIELKTFVRTGVGIGAHAHLIRIPKEWEEYLLPAHAIYDEKKKVFRCNCGGEAHKNSFTYNIGGIVEHLLLAHGIPFDEQVIEGWKPNFEKQARRYLAHKYLKTKR